MKAQYLLGCTLALCFTNSEAFGWSQITAEGLVSLPAGSVVHFQDVLSVKEVTLVESYRGVKTAALVVRGIPEGASEQAEYSFNVPFFSNSSQNNPLVVASFNNYNNCLRFAMLALQNPSRFEFVLGRQDSVSEPHVIDTWATGVSLYATCELVRRTE